MSVPNSMVGLIIGKGGENIRKLQEGGCRVQIARESDMRPGETARAVALYGTAANANWPEKFRHILHGELKPKGWLVCHKCSTSQLNVATVSAAYKYLSPIGSVGKKS